VSQDALWKEVSQHGNTICVFSCNHHSQQCKSQIVEVCSQCKNSLVSKTDSNTRFCTRHSKGCYVYCYIFIGMCL